MKDKYLKKSNFYTRLSHIFMYGIFFMVVIIFISIPILMSTDIKVSPTHLLIIGFVFITLYMRLYKLVLSKTYKYYALYVKEKEVSK